MWQRPAGMGPDSGVVPGNEPSPVRVAPCVTTDVTLHAPAGRWSTHPGAQACFQRLLRDEATLLPERHRREEGAAEQATTDFRDASVALNCRQCWRAGVERITRLRRGATSIAVFRPGRIAASEHAARFPRGFLFFDCAAPSFRRPRPCRVSFDNGVTRNQEKGRLRRRVLSFPFFFFSLPLFLSSRFFFHAKALFSRACASVWFGSTRTLVQAIREITVFLSATGCNSNHWERRTGVAAKSCSLFVS